jgi:hypothetical protein
MLGRDMVRAETITGGKGTYFRKENWHPSPGVESEKKEEQRRKRYSFKCTQP